MTQREVSEAAGKTDRTFKAFLNPSIERGEGKKLPIESFEPDGEEHKVEKVVNSGYHCTVCVGSKFAFKFYKYEPASAVEESKNLRKILSVVNPTGREIGIMPRPVSSLGESMRAASLTSTKFELSS